MTIQRLAAFVVRHPRAMLAAWIVAVAAGAPGALFLARIAESGSEAIRGSESRVVMETLDERYGRGTAHAAPVVVTSDSVTTDDPRFAQAVGAIADALTGRLSGADSARVTHFWNTGLPALRGRDGRSALVLVQPGVRSLGDAEAATPAIRLALTASVPDGFTARATGMSAMFHDLNRQSAADLLRAEMVGIPLTLIVLLLVFRTARAAGVALAVAVTSVVLSSAFLYVMHGVMPATVLAQNVITMIGLGAGTDYALFVLMHHREERAHGSDHDASIVAALAHAGPAVLASGFAVAGGFASLFLVNARFVHNLALGGVAVVLIALAATLTLLPALMHFAGPGLVKPVAKDAAAGRWSRFAAPIIRRPVAFLLLGLAISVVCAWPATKTRAWSFGPRDLPSGTESRLGFETLASQFERGWSAPTIVLAESDTPGGLATTAARTALGSRAEALAADARVAHVIPLPVSQDGRTAGVLAVLRESPETQAAQQFAMGLRERLRADTPGGVRFRVGGGSAILADFDAEMFSSLRRVMLAVIVVTFVLLFLFLRSVTVPIKAIVANLLSVVAAYGFLVVVFQWGVGASLIGIEPPGGLNAFVVLMLFTILFGLSMDYEIFLLSRMRDEYRRTRDNAASVAAGLSGTAAVITGAAAVMVCLFGSFGFFGLTASREFGLGLAFAVAFDATVVRLLLVPATMRLMGRWNWWPGIR